MIVDFNINEELLELIPMHNTTTSDHIFDQLSNFQDYGFDLGNLVCLSTAGAGNMAGKHNGVGAKLQKKVNDFYPDSPFAHFYCIIYQ